MCLVPVPMLVIVWPFVIAIIILVNYHSVKKIVNKNINSPKARDVLHLEHRCHRFPSAPSCWPLPLIACVMMERLHCHRRCSVPLKTD